MTATNNLPFTLPSRPVARRIRKVDAGPGPAERAQPMRGFEDRFTDVVDYIVRITDEIWRDRAIGYIRDTYDPECVVYSPYGVLRTAEHVVQATLASVAAYPDGDAHHINVAWSGDDEAGFYTAHLGFGRATNLAPTVYGPATGRRYAMRFAADCVSRANLIHTEWLLRDAGACVRQLGFDLDAAARAVAALPVAEPYIIAAPTASSRPSAAAPGSPDAWACELFETVWNGRRFDKLHAYYAPEVTVHSGGGRTVQGIPALSTLIVSILASIPDGILTVDNVCWAEETDGVIVAVRWMLVGTSARGGILGHELPPSKPVYLMGSSHLRLAGPRVIEEWTVFDEVATMAMAYRG